MEKSKRLSFNQFTTAMNAGDILRQNMLKARLQNGDQQLVNDSWEQFGHAFKDRYYQKSADTRSAVVSSLYRQAISQSKGTKKSGLGDQALGLAAAPIQQGTSELLQQAWLNLVDSFGATLIWINIHWFLNRVIGDKFFCDLGKEWLLKAGSGGKEGSGQMVESLTEKPFAALGLLEKGVIVMLDIIVAILLLIIVTIIVLIVYYSSHAFEAVWDLAAEFVKVLTT
jgi:hypothetical protein